MARYLPKDFKIVKGETFETEVELDFNPNEILPQESERREFNKSFKAEYTIISAAVGVVLIIFAATIYNFISPNKPVAIGSIRVVMLPIAFSCILFFTTLKKKEKYELKRNIVGIIDNLSDRDSIPVSVIVKTIKPDYDKEKDEYFKKQIITNVIDILWESYITEYKYVIDKKRLVRIKNEENSKKIEK